MYNSFPKMSGLREVWINKVLVYVVFVQIILPQDDYTPGNVFTCISLLVFSSANMFVSHLT